MYVFELKALPSKIVVYKNRDGEEVSSPYLIGMNPEGGEVRESVFSYREHMIDALNRPPAGQGGIDLLTMRKKIKVLERLEESKDGDVVEFEDAEWDTIKECVKETPWRLVMRQIVEYMTDVEEARPKEKEKKV